MSYNNDWQGNPPQGYYPQPQGYYRNQPQPFNGPFVYQKPRKKRSSAKEGIDKKGRIWVTAWNVSKEKGVISAFACENVKSTRSTSKKGYKFVTMMFEIIYKRTGNKMLELANYNVTTGKVYLKKLGMVISTKAPNGGYMGGIKKR